MEQSPHPAHTSYCPTRWSRAHLKINASKRNQHLTWLFDISYTGREESLNLAPEGFGRPTWASYLIGRRARRATGPSHLQFAVTSLPVWAAAQSSQGRADQPGKVHRHMADPTTAPPTGWGLAPRRGWPGRHSSQRNPFNTFLHSFCRYRPHGQAELKANTPAQPAVSAGRRACVFTETKITELAIFFHRSFSGAILFHYICLGS